LLRMPRAESLHLLVRIHWLLPLPLLQLLPRISLLLKRDRRGEPAPLSLSLRPRAQLRRRPAAPTARIEKDLTEAPVSLPLLRSACVREEDGSVGTSSTLRPASPSKVSGRGSKPGFATGLAAFPAATPATAVLLAAAACTPCPGLSCQQGARDGDEREPQTVFHRVCSSFPSRSLSCSWQEATPKFTRRSRRACWGESAALAKAPPGLLATGGPREQALQASPRRLGVARLHSKSRERRTRAADSGPAPPPLAQSPEAGRGIGP